MSRRESGLLSPTAIGGRLMATSMTPPPVFVSVSRLGYSSS